MFEFDSYLGGTNQLACVPIPSGKFNMGSPRTEKGRSQEVEDQFSCELTFEFWMAAYPITNLQFRSLLNLSQKQMVCASRTEHREDMMKHPVVCISWTEAMEFCNVLNQMFASKLPDDHVIILPTEAMWEYSCRAGTTTRYYCGDEDECLNAVAWHAGNSGGVTHPVGEKEPNSFGLYDMHGNVFEICRDEFEFYPSEPQTNWIGSYSSDVRAIRGGGWITTSGLGALRSASRCEVEVDDRFDFLGFRIAVAPGVGEYLR